MKRRFAPWAFLMLGASAGTVCLMLAGISVGWDGTRGGVPCVDCPGASAAAPAIAIASIVAIALLPMAALWFRAGGRGLALLALWGGAMLPLVFAAVFLAQPTGALASFSLTVYAIYMTLAISIGGACQARLEMVISGRQRPPASE